MIFTETPIPGAQIVELQPHADERGWFARSFDAAAFRNHGLDPTVAQCNLSYNERAGTLPGMHYQRPPHGEPKLVRCTRGAIYDAIIDLRRDSPAYCRWFGIELTPENAKSLYIPAYVAHGFQTLAPRSEVHYQMGAEYVPDAARGVRWDDPAFAIGWPTPPEGGRVISPRDASYPDFER